MAECRDNSWPMKDIDIEDVLQSQLEDVLPLFSSQANTPEDRKDLSYLILHDIIKGLPSLRKWEKLRPWARKIAHARLDHYIKSQINLREHEIKEADLSIEEWRELLENWEGNHSGCSERFDIAERRMDLRIALDRLSSTAKRSIEMHYFEGLSVSEIADRLQIKPETVRKRIGRALNELRTRSIDLLEE